MSENVLSWIFGAAVTQGAVLIVALAMLDVRNSQARWLLVAVLFLLTLTLGEEFLDVTDAQLGIGIGLVAEVLLWPLLYLFIGALAEDDPRPLRTQWPHAIAFLLAVAWYAYLSATAENNWMSLSNPDVRHQIAATVLAKTLYFCVYVVLILRRPLEYSSKPEPSRRALRWVRRFMVLVCVTYAIGALSFLAFYLELSWAPDSDYVGGLIMVIAIYALGYFALANRNVFDVQPHRRDDSKPAPEIGALAARARAQLIDSRAFLDPDLSLRALADALETGEARLSEALNQDYDGGFYALVNDLRLSACLALLDDPTNDDRTVLELAFEAGFRSKATFYRYFKAKQGVTPRAYRQKV